MTRLFAFLTLLLFPYTAEAFCGFYVAKADADLFNKAPKVVIARAEERTVMTMANDFQGEVKDFAVVIPVPEVITEKQVNVGETRIIDHLDAYTAPRLVEYFDSDPCQRMYMEKAMRGGGTAMMAMAPVMDAIEEADLGVTVEASYSVGEYDILILSAKESGGLLKWLNREGYKLPKGAAPILKSYLKQDMKFFVAKVNLEKFETSGFTYLRPLQVAYESEKFMLPIRLGTLNADGAQEIIVFTLTQNGRVEPANYRTVKIPTGDNIPLFVKNDDEFGEFYKAMFDTQVKKEAMKTVFLEYAWDMAWCDPCAADPLPNEDLRSLGAWWVDKPRDRAPPIVRPMQGQSGPRGQQFIAPMPRPGGGPVNVYVTRLHARYTAETFPEDLMLHETADRTNFQGRYVLQHPWKGEASCKAGEEYLAGLPKRFDKEAQTLSRLTGWDIADIRAKMEKGGQSFTAPKPAPKKPWWEEMWGESR